MTEHSAVTSWLAYLTDRGRSPTTIHTYRSVMAHYARTVGDPIAATLDDADNWWATIADNAPTSRTRDLSTVRSFYRWAQRFDHLAASPVRRLDPPSIGRKLPRPIGRDDWRRLLEHTEGELRRAVCLGGWAGLRVAEVAALDWADVDLDTRRAVVRGKGDKDRVVGMSPTLIDNLLPNTGGNVVRAGAGPAYSANTLQVRANRHLRELGIDGTFHKLRARFATMALAGTGDLLGVSRALGHASTVTTAAYAAGSSDDLDKIAAAAAE